MFSINKVTEHYPHNFFKKGTCISQEKAAFCVKVSHSLVDVQICEPAATNVYSCIITHSGSLFILSMCTIWIKSSELLESIALTITVSGTVQSTTECWESHLSTCRHSHPVPVNQGEETITKSLRFLFSYEFTMKTVYII